MKAIKSVRFYTVFFLLLIVISSCNHYIDSPRRKSIQVMQGNISFYPDSNVLVYKTNVNLKQDNEVLKPKSFYTALPKNLLWYEMDNSTSFSFYYNKEQVINININSSDALNGRDTTYIPNQSELDLLINQPSSSTNAKYDIKKMVSRNGRKQLIIKKGSATIWLFNILPKNYNLFVGYLKGFKFL